MAPLARGGFGAVYVAEQLTTERRVALKVLARYDDLVSVERLLTEARVTSRIVSDHIVQVIDAGVDRVSGDVFVVMELLRGMTLDERVLQQGALPGEEVAEYMRQIAIGLDRAHGNVDRNGRPTPIVHRDMKPSNIFITTRDDGQPLLKILDFGAAKVLSQTTKASGLIRGTPLFMASEQALGEPSTKGTDIWAFGLIAFYLLTGHSYWLTVQRDGTEDQLFAEILMLPLPSASQRARELGLSAKLTPNFDAWFARCVNRVQAQRFTSAGAAAGELARLLGVEKTVLVRDTRHWSAAPVAAATEPHRSTAQLESHDVAALSRTRKRQSANGDRTRISLATLALVLLGASAVAAFVFWKRAPVPATQPSSISALAPPSVASAPLPTPIETALPTSSAAWSATPPAVDSASARPPAKATPSARAPGTEKRPSTVRPNTPVKPAVAPRDPYEQR
ncbi:MAG TPA: protein kinase [Polyangiaceae bacterium]|nr:protein kinase [Polyangiaceae bacterium]